MAITDQSYKLPQMPVTFGPKQGPMSPLSSAPETEEDWIKRLPPEVIEQILARAPAKEPEGATMAEALRSFGKDAPGGMGGNPYYTGGGVNALMQGVGSGLEIRDARQRKYDEETKRRRAELAARAEAQGRLQTGDKTELKRLAEELAARGDTAPSLGSSLVSGIQSLFKRNGGT